MTKNEIDSKYMARAIELAKLGAGHVNPNPMVGAVIVKDGRVIGEGYHTCIGKLHAEREALAACTEDPRGATIYVTLEPCSHHGKQPPCADALIDKGIARVVVGSRDPNPKVAGKGNARLRAAGIEVIEDFMKEECDAVNPVFLKYIERKTPYVAMKYAMTADGKIATDTGKSQWITGPEARKHVHELRAYYMGILVGIGTVLADDPMLNCRLDAADTPDGRAPRNPVRIVMDSKLRIPEKSRLVQTAKQIPLIIATALSDADREEKKDKIIALASAGAEIINISNEEGRVDITRLLEELGQRGIDGILVEGGGMVNAAFAREGKVDKVYAYVGAKLFGGTGKYTPVSGTGIDEVSESLALVNPVVRAFGSDVLIEYDTAKGE